MVIRSRQVLRHFNEFVGSTAADANNVSYEHWRRQLWGTGARAPLDLQQFIFSAL